MSNTVYIHPAECPPSALPLSFGVASRGLVFVSGMVAFDLATGEVVGDTLAEQAQQTIQNLAVILAEHALTLEDAIKVKVYLANIRRDFDAFNEVYAARFPAPYPSRTTVQAVLASDALLVEIELVAAERQTIDRGDFGCRCEQSAS